MTGLARGFIADVYPFFPACFHSRSRHFITASRTRLLSHPSLFFSLSLSFPVVVLRAVYQLVATWVNNRSTARRVNLTGRPFLPSPFAPTPGRGHSLFLSPLPPPPHPPHTSSQLPCPGEEPFLFTAVYVKSPKTQWSEGSIPPWPSFTSVTPLTTRHLFSFLALFFFPPPAQV